ncbi:ABC transporter substrate-binding protein [Ruminococcaceae bacterium OttesenSCG-928-A16]|nr:ABC transporter substrate-binding protein [Ruminococcaceae bacterium OttesenSCG-928-A16]
MKNSMFVKVATFALALVLAFGLVACGETPPSSTAPAGGATSEAGAAGATGAEFVIGNPQPLTGVNAQVGAAANKGAALAVKIINENGGFNGVPVRLINYDDQGSPEEAVKIATKMVEDDKVDAVLGSLTSTCMLAAGQVYEDAGVLTFGTGTSPTWMLQGWEYVFRACPNNGVSMPLLVSKMKEMGIETVGVFRGLDDAAKSAAETFVEECDKMGVEVLTVESYTDGDTDYSGQIAKIISKNPDVVLCSTNGPTMAIFAKQLRQLGYQGLAFNREALPADTVEVAGSAADHWVFMYPYITYETPEDAFDPDIKEFLELFQEEYGEMPFHDCAYRSWDAIMVMAEAARIAGTNDVDAMRDAVVEISNFKALGGVMDFSAGNGEGLNTLNSYIVLDGKYEDFDAWYAAGNYEALKNAG